MLFLVAGDVAQRDTSDRAIFNCDRQILVTRGGTWLRLNRRRFILKMI